MVLVKLFLVVWIFLSRRDYTGLHRKTIPVLDCHPAMKVPDRPNRGHGHPRTAPMKFAVIIAKQFSVRRILKAIPPGAGRRVKVEADGRQGGTTLTRRPATHN
jgi:hypothetical protein